VTGLPPPAQGCGSCAARDREIAELRARLERLERIVSRNSGNSSMPPSADGLPGRKPPRKQRRAAGRVVRKRGKQPGSPGVAMSWAEPDQVEDHYPDGACGCGADLAGAADMGVVRSCQQVEISEPAARRIQHDLHQVRCGCGLEHVAPRPPGVPDSAVSVGPNLRALAVYLLVFQHLPVERCRQLIADLTGGRVSAGFIHSCLASVADAISDVVKLIRTLITATAVAGFDETTLRCGQAGQKKHVLGAFTEDYSALFLGERTLASFRDFGILPGFAGVVVSDRYQN
jgi:transposase